MPVTRLKKFLDEKRIKYVTIRHSPTFTAQEIAASAHIPGKELAKTVMIKRDGKMAMPPFGNLYGMEVFVAPSLTEDEEIAFNAGSHTELMRLAYRDFEEAVSPVTADFALKGQPVAIGE